MSSEQRRVGFYDTTLRDGEQMPGVVFDRSARLRIARALDNAGVDEIELGFAASGELQQDDILAVTRSGLTARTLSLARPMRSDIDAAVRSEVRGVILFASISDIHLRDKVRKSRNEVMNQVEEATRYARSLDLFVQVSIEDATRTDDEHLASFARRAECAGAERIGLADTVGVATPDLMSRKVAVAREAISRPVSVHCHNDFGLAVANSLAAVRAGASFLSTTMLGLGERGGNAATEECAAALEILLGFRTNIKLKELSRLGRLVAECAKLPIPGNKAVVGQNCFRHESGIHVAAVLRNPLCYEGYDPGLVGGQREIVLGKTNGRAAVRFLAKQIGEELDDSACSRILDQVKVLAEEGKLGGAGAGLVDSRLVLRRLIDEFRS
jgi:methanogen homocitrate synthase